MKKIEKIEPTQIVLYRAGDKDVAVEVYLKDETFWLTQKAMAKLFDCSIDNVSLHLKNIFNDGELEKKATVEDFSIVQNEGNRQVERKMTFYNLEAIISVGYRVNSKRATKFRQWATRVLKEFTIKGFVLDDERLKQGERVFGADYFKELLEKVRSIRASERRIWQQITDIFAECSINYDKNSKITKEFYSMVQNKFHYAITGKTAPEIIKSSADKSKTNMGLTTWKNSPDGRILKSDVTIAKNYLSMTEIKRLERSVSGYFDYIEDLIERGNTFTMKEFAASVDEFLSFRKYDILKDKGSVSKKNADSFAKAEYDEFNKVRKFISDFDESLNNN